MPRGRPPMSKEATEAQTPEPTEIFVNNLVSEAFEVVVTTSWSRYVQEHLARLRARYPSITIETKVYPQPHASYKVFLTFTSSQNERANLELAKNDFFSYLTQLIKG